MIQNWCDITHWADITCALFANMPYICHIYAIYMPFPAAHSLALSSALCTLKICCHISNHNSSAIFCRTLPYFEAQQNFAIFWGATELCHILRQAQHRRPHTMSIQALCHLFAGITAEYTFNCRVYVQMSLATSGKCEKNPKLQQQKQGYLEGHGCTLTGVKQHFEISCFSMSEILSDKFHIVKLSWMVLNNSKDWSFGLKY